MEENKETDFDDLKDFGEEKDFIAPNLDELEQNIQEKEEDIIVPNFENDTKSLEETLTSDAQNTDSVFQFDESLNKKTEEEQDIQLSEGESDTDESEENEKTEEELEEERQNMLQKKFEENSKNLEQWEELDSNNDIVKKYIVYVDKENIHAIDKLSIEERNKFINSAIKLKFETIDLQTIQTKKKRVILHTAIMIATTIIFMPFAFYIAHMSIIATFNNYKYSQNNFEKLYKESFSKSPTYQKAQKYTKYK